MSEDWRDIPLTDVVLPVRTANALMLNGVKTVGELADMDRVRFMRLPGIGAVAESECVALIRRAMNGTLRRASAVTLGDLAKQSR